MENFNNEELWAATYLEQKKLEQQKLEKNPNKKGEKLYDEKQKDYNENNKTKAEETYLKLKQNEVEVVLFDKEASFGSKIKDCKLLGFLYVIILGNKFNENGLFELEDRINSNKTFLKEEELFNFFKKSF